jgi:hypothetical protein
MSGRLELNFIDVTGAPLTDTVDIELRHQVLGEQRRVNDHDARRPIAITDLRTQPQGVYVVEARPRCYWPVQRLVTIPSSGQARDTMMLPIRPDRARAIFPDYDQLDARVRGVLERSVKVRGHEGLRGRAWYEALSDEATAGLLNIARKALTMPFENGTDLIDNLTLIEAREDRCFVEMPAAVRDQMKDLVDAGKFRSVNGSLHEVPEHGFEPAGSFKTFEDAGNLQMTFFTCGDRCVADIDIDDAAGLGHVFQVMRNHVTGKPTHPYNIHQILTRQSLNPGYQLMPKQG